MKAQLWHSTLGGGLYGLIMGVAAQIGRETQTAREQLLLAAEFYPWSPPHLVDLLRPHVIPVLFSTAFAMLGSFIFIIWARRQ